MSLHPVHVAAKCSNNQILCDFLKEDFKLASILDAYGNEPIHYASIGSQVANLRTLLQHKVNVNAKNGVNCQKTAHFTRDRLGTRLYTARLSMGLKPLMSIY
jgi:hypothetical protein